MKLNDDSRAGTHTPERTPRPRARTLATFAFCELIILISAWFQAGCMSSPQRIAPLPGMPASVNDQSVHGFVENPHPTTGRRASDPGATPALREEVWVIARDTAATTASTNEMPGSGSLFTEVEQKKVPVPLKHTDVKAEIDGY